MYGAASTNHTSWCLVFQEVIMGLTLKSCISHFYNLVFTIGHPSYSVYKQQQTNRKQKSGFHSTAFFNESESEETFFAEERVGK